MFILFYGVNVILCSLCLGARFNSEYANDFVLYFTKNCCCLFELVFFLNDVL